MFVTPDFLASADRSAASDFWYGPPGRATASGAVVSPESSLRLSAVYASVSILSETVAQLPFILYRRTPDGGKERATDHPLFKILFIQPNRWQTAYEWREMMELSLNMQGNAASIIMFAPNGAVAELIPMVWKYVTPQRLEGGGIRYIYQPPGEKKTTLNQYEVLHLRGKTLDGLVGISPIMAEKEAIGYGVAAQDYGSRFWKNDASMPGWIEHPGQFKSDEDRREFRQSFQNQQTGSERFKVAVLEFGLKYHQLQISNQDAQYLESRKYSDIEIARIYRVPPHMIGVLGDATFSNIEHLGIEFVTQTMMPHFVRWEQAVFRDLLDEDEQQIYFAEFLTDALLRGDTKSRYEAYNSGITAGWLVRNEARVKENLNPLPGLWEPLAQLNMGSGNQSAEASSSGRLYAGKLAERVANKEIAAVDRHSHDAQYVMDFYKDHAAMLVDSLGIDAAMADKYCTDTLRVLSACDIAATVEDWRSGTKVATLLQMMGFDK